MTILSALERAYGRIPDAPKIGFASQRIGLVIGLDEDGSIATVADMRLGEGKKRTARTMAVPQPVKRTVAVLPNSFWDKTAYALGVTAGAGRRTALEHQAFVDHHRALIAGSNDEGLVALLRFLDVWTPDMFGPPHFKDDMKDENVVFALEEERRRDVYLHDRLAARALLAGATTEGEDEGEGERGDRALCLVTGRRAPIARLHPSIKGVWGGQTAGASIVSFNLDAFESYGHSQGDNAPVSALAAAAYTGALNRFLTKDSGHRVQIGDTSTVFWAEADSEDAAKLSEEMFKEMVDEDAASTSRVGDILARLREQTSLLDAAPDLAKDVKFYILGLAPNAARVSIRFWVEDDFGQLVENYVRFWNEMRIEPPDRKGVPPLWAYLSETAARGKSENVPSNLAGEWMRAILSGTPYPLTLLSTLLMRIRSDGIVNARRVSMLKALVIRNFRNSKEAPVSLDPDNRNRGYLLGRLFAVYEFVQTAALGRNVNATIKDKFYGSASAQPQKVFRLLDSGSANHLSKIGKQRPGQRTNLEKAIGAIMEMMKPSENPFPATLTAEEQALFGLGYYHQRSAFFARKDAQSEEPTLA